MKKFNWIVSIMLLVGLISSPVFAGQVVPGTTGSVASEIMGATRNVSISGTPALGLSLGNTLQNNTLLQLNLSGGGVFTTGVQYYLCTSNAPNSASANVQIANATAAAVNTQLPIPVTSLNVNVANVALGTTIWVTNDSLCNKNGAFNFLVSSGTAAGNIGLSGNVTLLGSSVLLDTFAANNVASVQNQFSTTLTSQDLVTIDYLTGAANGTTIDNSLVLNGVASNRVGISVNKLVVTNNTVVVNNVAQAGGAFNQVVTLHDSQNWTAINRVYLTASNSCTSGAVNAAANAPFSGNVTLNFPSVTSTTSSAITLCVQVDGSTAIPAREISGTYSYVVSTGTGLVAPAGGGSLTSAWQVWSPNGYQAFNPYMYVGPTAGSAPDVFVRFYNNSAQTANVFVDVYPDTGATSVRQTLGTIGPNASGLYWGSNIGTNAGLQAGASYAALFTLTAPKDKVNGVSFFKRSEGERQMPLYKSVNGASNYLTE